MLSWHAGSRRDASLPAHSPRRTPEPPRAHTSTPAFALRARRAGPRHHAWFGALQGSPRGSPRRAGARRYAVRRVVFSPHAENVVASCSYDLTVRLWDVAAPEDAALRVWDHHSEFAVGLDFSTLAEGLLASTGWDELTFVWPAAGDPRGGPR